VDGYAGDEPAPSDGYDWQRDDPDVGY